MHSLYAGGYAMVARALGPSSCSIGVTSLHSRESEYLPGWIGIVRVVLGFKGEKIEVECGRLVEMVKALSWNGGVELGIVLQQHPKTYLGLRDSGPKVRVSLFSEVLLTVSRQGMLLTFCRW